MREGVRARAAAELEDVLKAFGGSRALASLELAAYGARFVRGWEIPSLCVESRYQLRILIPTAFPFHPPRVAVSPAPSSLQWPHVEEHGLLCLLPDAAGHSIFDTRSVVLTLLNDAAALVAISVAGGNLEHFEDEFVSYWDRWEKTKATMNVMCHPRGPTRWVSSWHGRDDTLVAENEDTLRRWVQNHYGMEAVSRLAPQPVPLLWLPRPLRPKEYPASVGALLDLLHDLCGGAEFVERLLLDQRAEYKSILLAFAGRRGVGFAGLRVAELKRSRGASDPLTKGFRGQPPSGVLLARSRGLPFNGAKVRRFDASWVHGRDHNEAVEDLASRSVVVLGVGSVGSPAAELLAKAGVGRIVLIDGEPLGSENISRHVLGAQAVGVNKALALAKLLSARFPHLTIEHHALPWEGVYAVSPDLVQGADLVVSTMGTWRSESALSALAVELRKLPPILFGWTEAHAAAGHALAVFPGQGCLRCITDDTGHPLFPVAVWPTESTLVPIPACGGMFQPYGAMELAHIHALIADLAVEVLLKRVATSTHVVWVGERKLMQAHNGTWNPRWIQRYGDPEEGGFISTVDFDPDRQCPLCGGER